MDRGVWQTADYRVTESGMTEKNNKASHVAVHFFTYKMGYKISTTNNIITYLRILESSNE